MDENNDINLEKTLFAIEEIVDNMAIIKNIVSSQRTLVDLETSECYLTLDSYDKAHIYQNEKVIIFIHPDETITIFDYENKKMLIYKNKYIDLIYDEYFLSTIIKTTENAYYLFNTQSENSKLHKHEFQQHRYDNVTFIAGYKRDNYYLLNFEKGQRIFALESGVCFSKYDNIIILDDIFILKKDHKVYFKTALDEPVSAPYKALVVCQNKYIYCYDFNNIHIYDIENKKYLFGVANCNSIKYLGADINNHNKLFKVYSAYEGIVDYNESTEKSTKVVTREYDQIDVVSGVYIMLKNNKVFLQKDGKVISTDYTNYKIYKDFIQLKKGRTYDIVHISNPEKILVANACIIHANKNHLVYQKDGKYGFYRRKNSKHDEYILYPYDDAKIVSNEIHDSFIISQWGKKGLFNYQVKTVIEPDYQDLVYLNLENLYLWDFYILEKEDGTKQFCKINKTNAKEKIIFEDSFTDINVTACIIEMRNENITILYDYVNDLVLKFDASVSIKRIKIESLEAIVYQIGTNYYLYNNGSFVSLLQMPEMLQTTQNQAYSKTLQRELKQGK